MNTTRIAQLPYQLLAQARSLADGGMRAPEICERLQITKSSEWNAVVELCATRPYRRFQKGVEVGGPVRAVGSRKYTAA